ncbi:hypothetical protein [Streptomyces sp. CLV115]|uniref:hypothetical protein n=1 Tax=Streptomyces sp. CLV115 TaxID=3138502 RepID=UPI00406D0B76
MGVVGPPIGRRGTGHRGVEDLRMPQPAAAGYPLNDQPRTATPAGSSAEHRAAAECGA